VVSVRRGHSCTEAAFSGATWTIESRFLVIAIATCNVLLSSLDQSSKSSQLGRAAISDTEAGDSDHIRSQL
jgi:hypothetical protein